jgi:adenosylcobinamide-phosphate synthase
MVGMPGDPGIVLAALLVEACVGYPRPILDAIGHPVTWMGQLLDLMERNWNRASFAGVTRRWLGVVTVLIVVGIAGLAGYGLVLAVAGLEYAVLLVVLIATTGLAQRSLYQHVRDVQTPLNANDLASARVAVGRIVGRDTDQLSADQVSAAAIESLAESFNDAVVAPGFWLLAGGLPGLLAYKAINTADSMSGHREERWRHFGWAAARLDDLVNLIPARIAGLLIALAGRRGFATMWRHASKHASPNAGWTEAALAGALGVRLGGPAYYDGALHARPSFGDGATPRVADVARALSLYKRACALLWLLVALICIAQTAISRMTEL